MSKIITCLDCPLYQTGGYCRYKRKDVGALQPACDHAKKKNEKFNPEDSETMEQTTEQTTTPTTKHCSRCGQDLPLDAFGSNKSAKDGKQRWCKKCMNEATSRAKGNRPKRERERERETAASAPSTTDRIVVRETLTDEQMVMALRAHGWEVTCRRTITQEL